jgi:hypothetical protein
VVSLAGLPEPLAELVTAANNGTTTPERALRAIVERGAEFVVAIGDYATHDVRRALRRALRSGQPLPEILVAQAERVRRDLASRGAFDYSRGGPDAEASYAQRVAEAAAALGVELPEAPRRWA